MYLSEFANVEDIVKNYSAPNDILDGADVLLAWYGYGDYCGDAFVLYRKNGALFEVNGSHCSCSGLEGQWIPEETSWEALKLRNVRSSCDGAETAQNELNKLVNENLPSSK